MNWVKHLRRLGVDVSPHGQFMPKPGEKEWDILNEEEREIAKLPFEPRDIGIVETTPFSFDINQSKVKIANTMGESDRLGKPWVNACNAMDYLIVPNDFQRRVFIESGVTKPVRVIPHGTETEKFPYIERPERDIFTFGIIGWLDQRKGALDVIQAFASEFDKDEPVRLILKTTNPAFGYYSNFKDKRIKTINRLVSPEEIKQLYYEMDCFVFPSKAEGIGQPPREAMATGLPVIVTNYSGLEELVDSGIAYGLEPSHFTDRSDFPEQPGRWAHIDIQELMYRMRYVYEHREEARKRGQQGAMYIRTYNSWGGAAKKMIEFLKEL